MNELDMVAHLLKVSESHPVTGKVYYPFFSHDRFIFFMHDRILRHHALNQTNVYLKQNPQDASMSIEDIQRAIENGEEGAMISRLYAFSANITGSTAYW